MLDTEGGGCQDGLGAVAVGPALAEPPHPQRLLAKGTAHAAH